MHQHLILTLKYSEAKFNSINKLNLRGITHRTESVKIKQQDENPNPWFLNFKDIPIAFAFEIVFIFTTYQATDRLYDTSSVACFRYNQILQGKLYKYHVIPPLDTTWYTRGAAPCRQKVKLLTCLSHVNHKDLAAWWDYFHCFFWFCPNQTLFSFQKVLPNKKSR